MLVVESILKHLATLPTLSKAAIFLCAPFDTYFCRMSVDRSTTSNGYHERKPANIMCESHFLKIKIKKLTYIPRETGNKLRSLV